MFLSLMESSVIMLQIPTEILDLAVSQAPSQTLIPDGDREISMDFENTSMSETFSPIQTVPFLSYFSQYTDDLYSVFAEIQCFYHV